jgi:hypothetical protein
MADDSTLTTLGQVGVGGGLATAGAGYGGRELGNRYLTQRYGNPTLGEGIYKTRRGAFSALDSVRKFFRTDRKAPPFRPTGEMPTKLDAAMFGRLKGRAIGKGGLIAAGIGLPLLAIGKGVDAYNGTAAAAPAAPQQAEVAQASQSAGTLVPQVHEPIVRPAEAPPVFASAEQPPPVRQLSHREEARQTIANKAKSMLGSWWGRMHRTYGGGNEG